MNELEQAFDRGQRKYMPEYYVINQPDFPWSAVKRGLQNTKFLVKQQPDRLLLSRARSWCFELKQCKNKRFAFKRLKKHQEAALVDFAKRAGAAYLVVSFLGLGRVFAVPVQVYQHLKRTVGKKSVNLDDVAARKGKRVREIPVEVPQSNPRLVLTALFQPTLEDFVA